MSFPEQPQFEVGDAMYCEWHYENVIISSIDTDDDGKPRYHWQRINDNSEVSSGYTKEPLYPRRTGQPDAAAGEGES